LLLAIDGDFGKAAVRPELRYYERYNKAYGDANYNE
jgi:hypothetical protein